ncbi:C-8 sterol isomerase [Arthrobotrys musiformis]|uniref:C-8 sterol isomerase n=1 Tax=Arthrobotrys musiformis TaxID=47236 RepID=A0AAV9VWF6_9PEZI
MRFDPLNFGRAIVYITIIFSVLDRYVLPKFHVFDPVKLQEICNESIELYGDDSPNYNRTLLFNDLAARLQKEYPKHVSEVKWDEWVFNNAGNAMGGMVLLHASISEYLIIFGTPVGTEGHTGIHMAHDYFTILTGRQDFYYAGDVEKRVFLPGDQNHMRRGDKAQYALNGFALELAQGCIPCMLPFGFLEAMTSTLDYQSLSYTVWVTARHMTKSLLQGKL